MILLDENVGRDQWRLLHRWGIRARQIGHEVGRSGTSDDQIIPLLHRLNRVTFITLDVDFLDPTLRHPNYCLIFLGAQAGEAAYYTRRALNHPALNTRSKRMGCVAAVSKLGLRLWRWRVERDGLYPWLA